MKTGFLLLMLVFINASVLLAGHDQTVAEIARTLAGYQGPKCMLTVSDFAVEIPGAPQEIGDGLREMLQTALFQSNHFIVLDRLDVPGISAEQLLSDSFMADADSILLTGQMNPAEVLIYGSLVDLTGGGAGLRARMPWMPLTVGGSYANAEATILIRAVDAASGRILAVSTVESSVSSTRGSIGTTFRGIDMPLELEMFRNTPVELCIRDTIYRAVIDLTRNIPPEYFRHSH